MPAVSRDCLHSREKPHAILFYSFAFAVSVHNERKQRYVAEVFDKIMIAQGYGAEQTGNRDSFFLENTGEVLESKVLGFVGSEDSDC